jgi:hypothetical protein
MCTTLRDDVPKRIYDHRAPVLQLIVIHSDRVGKYHVDAVVIGAREAIS